MNDKIWVLFDFDDVVTSGQSKGNSDVRIFIDILTLRKRESITFQDSCLKLGLHPLEMAKRYAKATPPNLKIKPILRLFSMWKRIGKPYFCGIASNNSDYLISFWLKHYKLERPFSILLTPEKFGWIRKPQREFFSKCINVLKVNPDQIIFYDDDITNVDIANKMGINGYVYHRYDHFQEIEQYIKDEDFIK